MTSLAKLAGDSRILYFETHVGGGGGLVRACVTTIKMADMESQKSGNNSTCVLWTKQASFVIGHGQVSVTKGAEVCLIPSYDVQFFRQNALQVAAPCTVLYSED
jgi:hypothetical protein